MANTDRKTLEPVKLASVRPVATAPSELRSGTYDKMSIEVDGSAELALPGREFFRSVWINEIALNEIEIRPMGAHSLEFDTAGSVQMSLIAMTPGNDKLRIPGADSGTQSAVSNIRWKVRADEHRLAMLEPCAA